MRIVQSLWSCNKPNFLKENYGWLSPEYNVMSWALSCLQLRQYYDDVILYADTNAAKLLIDYLGLPYSDIICKLDELNNYHPQLWALPKIFTYSLQNEPFLHVDGDVFVWEKFEDDLLESKLIAQNLEIATDYYGEIMQSLESSLTYFPDEILKDRKQRNLIHAYNAGIFGGSDIIFFKEYTRKAFEFVDRNVANFSKINVNNFNIFFEQYLFLCMVKQKNRDVNVLIKKQIGDNQYIGFGNFADVPYKKQYLHLLGGYKRNEATCVQMASRLRQDYPSYYYKIIHLFKKKNLPLKKDYYYFLNVSSDTELLRRSIWLKEQYKNNNIETGCNYQKTTLSHELKIERLPQFLRKKFSSSKIIDLSNVCNEINKIKNKFLCISNEYLYGRDLNIIEYFQYIFGNPNEIYKREIIADNLVEFISCKNDWSMLFSNQTLINKKNIDKFFSDDEIETCLAVIPECDESNFSIVKILMIDKTILFFLGKRKTIKDLLNDLKKHFENVPIKLSESDFEDSIIRRIKYGISFKIIKVLMPSD